jgi:hypothetical protein
MVARLFETQGRPQGKPSKTWGLGNPLTGATREKKKINKQKRKEKNLASGL